MILCKDVHALLHVISLVDWPKHVKSRSGGCLERSGDRKPYGLTDRRDDRSLISNARCGKFAS